MSATSGYRLEHWREQAQLVMAQYEEMGDPEAGHSAEDDLLHEFIGALAQGEIPDPQAAAQVLRVELFDHERTRWYS